jgi:hypothetical protein
MAGTDLSVGELATRLPIERQLSSNKPLRPDLCPCCHRSLQSIRVRKLSTAVLKHHDLEARSFFVGVRSPGARNWPGQKCRSFYANCKCGTDTRISSAKLLMNAPLSDDADGASFGSRAGRVSQYQRLAVCSSPMALDVPYVLIGRLNSGLAQTATLF